MKQLEAFDSNTFAYNAEGIRTRKNNITYELDGTKILREVRPNGSIEYYYGTSGVAGFRYNNADYFYQKNIQGDVTAIYTATGTKVAEYIYDAWGNCTVTLDTNGIGTINPIRYRSYYYVVETGLYYLQTRYYDPEIGRFINADYLEFLGADGSAPGYNLFAYCNNSPTNYLDQRGTLAYPGQIHNIVVNRIAKNNNLNKEQTILYKFGWGRADLISDDGEVWDVKRDKALQIANGVAQVEKYVKNKWKNNPKQKLRVGGSIESDSFFHTIGDETYYITYRYAGNGVIAYDYEKLNYSNELAQIASAFVGIIILVGVAYLVMQSGGALAPVLVSLIA